MMFELDNIIRTYGDRKVLDIPHLEIAEKEICALVGPNGAGKSTLLRILAFLQGPQEGYVKFKGSRINYSSNNLREIRLAVTMVEQNPFIFRGTVFANTVYGLKVRSVPRAESRLRVKEALERVGLAGFERRDARSLSGGEMQRLALARALILDPEVLLLDEPTAHVDSRRTESIEALILDIFKERDLTVVLATHDMRQARRMTEKIIYLDYGRLAEIDNSQHD